MLGMDEVSTIRHRVLVQGVSRRVVAKEMGVSRNTVRRYLAEGVPVQKRKPGARPKPVLESAKARLETLLTESRQWTGGKQRLTATQLWRLLRAEGVNIGATSVKVFMREWKRQRAEVFVPLVYRPGDLGEVDFFEVLVDLAGVRRKAWMFLMRSMASGRDFAWLFPRQDATCFLEGHVRAFEHFGGVLLRLAFDNLRPAVTKVLAGSERQLAPRFAALCNHYLFEPCFARPATGHDKGGVEARGKGVRWQHLVPIPKGDSLDAISRMLLARLDAEASEKCDPAGRTVLERFADERAVMLPLPEKPFEPAAVRHLTVTRRSLLQVEGGLYSVWSTWAGRAVTVYVGVNEVSVLGPDGVSVAHPRVGFGGRAVDYRHYLPELAKKPQAVRQVAHELLPKLGEVYARAWRQLVDEHGPKQAARVFAQVLKAVVADGETVVSTRLEMALAQGESLQLAVNPPPLPPPSMSLDALPSVLRDVAVASASAADFDALLVGAA
jgi:transposase